MSRKLTRAVAVFRVLLLMIVGRCHCSLPVFDPNKDSPDNVEDAVCSESYYTLLRVFYGLQMGDTFDTFKKDGFTIKPAEVSEDSPCYGMESTCCLSKGEKGIAAIVEFEYHKMLQSVFERRLGRSCNRLGRNVEKSIYQVMEKAKDILEQEISQIIGGKKVPNDLFKDFFQFLFRFIHMLDFCTLTDEIELQLRKLYQFIAKNIDDSPFTGQCDEEFEQHFINTWYNSSLNNLVETLNLVRLISETYRLTDSVVKDLLQHKFNHQCMGALFKLRHCSYCVGNSYDITVCDGHCINTIRGCMVDIYELGPHFKHLKQKLASIATVANAEFTPVGFVRSSLMEFVYMAKHLKALTNDPSTTVIKESCEIKDNSTVSLVATNSFTASAAATNTVIPTLKETMKDDLMCFEDIQSTVAELDEEMCGVNPKHLKYIRNRGCWNGTHTKGSYDYLLVGKERDDQRSNPSFRKDQFNTFNLYKKQIQQIIKLIHEMNQTSQFYECIATDDEDCRLFVLECTSSPSSNLVSDVHHLSGSGSGSGSGSYSIADTESVEVTYSILLHLGGPRRFNDFEKNKDKEISKSSNRSDTINDSEPTNDYNTSKELYTANNDSSDYGNSNISRITITDEETAPSVPVPANSHQPLQTSSTTIVPTRQTRHLPSNTQPASQQEESTRHGSASTVNTSMLSSLLASLLLLTMLLQCTL